MIFLWIILILLLIFVVMLGVAIVRTLRMTPTAAATAVFPDSDLERAQTYAQALSGLIQCDTVSSANETSRRKYSAFHKLLREQFPTVHKAATRTVLNGNLLLKIPGQDGGIGAPILLMSHHDVVPADGVWKYPPFSGEIAEGSVWGRGTVDTKSSLFCILQAAEELLQNGWTPECDVYIASSCTEEWSGEGAASTVSYLKEKGVHFGLILDEGGMIVDSSITGAKGRYAMIGIAEKGYLDVEFTAHSPSGHTGIPNKQSSLLQLSQFICKANKHSLFHAHFSPVLREMLKRMAPNMKKFSHRLLLGNLWLFEPMLSIILPRISPFAGAMMRTTVSFTTVEGSVSHNLLSHTSHAYANIRCMPQEGNEEVCKVLGELAQKSGLEMNVLKSTPACVQASFNSDEFYLVEQTIAKVFPNYGVCPCMITNSTDARFYEYEGIADTVLRFAPLEVNHQQYTSIHSIDENISIMALPCAVNFYRQLLTDYCSKHGKPELAPPKPTRKSTGRKKPATTSNTDATVSESAFEASTPPSSSVETSEQVPTKDE